MTVRHSSGSYEIRIAALAECLSQLPAGTRIITDEHVWQLYGRHLQSQKCLVLPAGEGSKSIDCFAQCLSWLAGTGATRQTTVVAFGGGVIGDLGGFVASAYMRGVPFRKIPTTLLAQVDSAVGGKVGIDLPEGKNLAGAFYPPIAVDICPDTLQSLPQRQMRNGMAEVLKYAFIMDPPLLDAVPDPLVAAADSNWSEIVLRCLRLKAYVVEQDERETSGLRAILNFGHTVGHAIEQVTGYGPVLHGEAISIGMVAEAVLGEQIGVTVLGTADRVRQELQRHGLPTSHEVLNFPDPLIAAMRRDKKATSANLAFSLLTRLGECKLISNASEEAVRSCLKAS
jgi:3-dehydroquinate synthase